MVVAGIRFDTSGARETGSRWQNEHALHRGLRRPPPAGPLGAEEAPLLEVELVLDPAHDLVGDHAVAAQLLEHLALRLEHRGDQPQVVRRARLDRVAVAPPSSKRAAKRS